jgi:hypothetical protein
VETHAGIWPSARKWLEIFVDQDHALGGGLVEAVAELQRPPGSVFLSACRHLAGESGLMPFVSQDAAA